MSFSKWIVGTVSALTLLSMSSSVAFAGTSTKTHAQHNHDLVALGDSISYGYNLGPNNNQPSQYAFPYLIGEATHEKVQDLAVPGATSSDLLSLLETSKTVDAAVSGAHTITIDIGSNDLLQIASEDGLLGSSSSPLTTLEKKQFVAAFQKFGMNLPSILKTVKKLAPKANIVLYNLYDPFPSSSPIHALAEQMVTPENQIISEVATEFGLSVVDAYNLFTNWQQDFVRPGDVHPTILGQEVLAAGGYAVFRQEKFDHSKTHHSK